MTGLTAVSLFSGIGAFEESLRRAGVRTVASVEIDPDCRGVLARHFPETTQFSDVTEVTGEQLRAAGFVPERGIVAGGFPCFAAGTRILAERGWVPIEDVVVGDRVLTHAGRWQPVTSVMSRVSDHTMRMHGQGLPCVVTTSEHPFYARSRRTIWSPRSAGRPNGTNLREFGEPCWIAAAKMVDQYAGQVLPPAEMSDGSPDLWWLVGRYLADGWTTTGSRRPSGVYKGNRIVICCARNEADELAERIARVVHATRTEDLTCTKFVITGAWLVRFVAQLGRGAAGKTLTRRELTLPTGEAEALLAGWLSGDGCRTQGQWKGTTVSRSLALSMALLAQRARGVVASLHETAVPSSAIIAGRVIGQQTQYQVVIPDRNRSAFIEGQYGWKLVRSGARTDGPVLVYNISVREDESYVADGAVVHNCQDVSVAGLRAGLGGARSGLFWQIMRLADELSPRWLILENVAGLLSAVCSCPGDDTCTGNARAVRCGRWDKRDGQPVFIPNVTHNPPGGACPGGCMELHGGAMGTVLGALGERGYGFAYRVLDARFFGLAQRRERVFIVGCLGNPAAAAEVLLESESSSRDLAPGSTTGPGPSTRVASCLGSGGTVSTLQASGGDRGYRIDAESAAGGQLIVVPLALRGRDGSSAVELGQPGDPAFALRTPGGGSSVSMVFGIAENQRGELLETSYLHQLTTGGGKPGQGYGAVRQGNAVRRLTPVEYERLQGFEDDWTRLLADGTEQSDSARYRQCGNAIAVPVAEWIARRIVAVDTATTQENQ